MLNILLLCSIMICVDESEESIPFVYCIIVFQEIQISRPVSMLPEKNTNSHFHILFSVQSFIAFVALFSLLFLTSFIHDCYAVIYKTFIAYLYVCIFDINDSASFFTAFFSFNFLIQNSQWKRCISRFAS